MWHDIALANQDALLNGLDDFEKHLRALRSAIERSDGKHCTMCLLVPSRRAISLVKCTLIAKIKNNLMERVSCEVCIAAWRSFARRFSCAWR
jgi:hypothetical protein